MCSLLLWGHYAFAGLNGSVHREGEISSGGTLPSGGDIVDLQTSNVVKEIKRGKPLQQVLQGAKRLFSMCPGGETGRRKGLKILFAVRRVRVQVPPRAPADFSC